MAKSLRSKWKRKCRAIKRERYGKKELDRLKKTLGINDTNKVNLDAALSAISEVAEVKDAKTILLEQEEAEENEAQNEADNEPETEIEMEVDGRKKIYNSKTLRDENGTYPVWLHPRKMKLKRKGKKAKKLKNKVGKKK